MKRSHNEITLTDSEIEEIIEKNEENFKLRIDGCISSFLKYYNLTEDNLTRIEGEIRVNGSIEWKFVVNDEFKYLYNFKLPLHENENNHEKIFLFYISKIYNFNNKIKLYRIC